MTRLTTMVSLLAISIAACGCGSGESNVIAAKYEPDPRFVSADSLIEYYNELMTTDPADRRGVIALIYAETPEQEPLIDHNLNLIAVLELHQALYDRFGKGYFPGLTDAFRPDGLAAITERSPRRATAIYRDADGKSGTVKLLQVGDRWWISGDMMAQAHAALSQEQRREVEMAFRVVGEVGKEIIPRLRSGEFVSYDEAARALWTRAFAMEPRLREMSRGGG